MQQRLLAQLLKEKETKQKGGLYHRTQIKLAHNSNRIEGSRLSEDQTRYIYETNTLSVEPGYLRDTCLSAQGRYTIEVEYFYPAEKSL